MKNNAKNRHEAFIRRYVELAEKLFIKHRHKIEHGHTAKRTAVPTYKGLPRLSEIIFFEEQ
jgi:hypothetical protein